MVRLSWIIQTEDGNAIIGSSKQHGDGDNNDAGSEIALFPLNDKGIHTEGLFLILDWPSGGVPIAS